MEYVNEISNTIFDNKENVSSEVYKNLMENLQKIHAHVRRYNENTESYNLDELMFSFHTQPKRKIHCSLCGSMGHNKRTCPTRHENGL